MKFNLNGENLVEDLEKLYNKKNEVYKLRCYYTEKLYKVELEMSKLLWANDKLIQVKDQYGDGLKRVYDMIENEVDKEKIKSFIEESLNTEKIVFGRKLT